MSPTVVPTETDRGLFVGAIVAAGYEVYAVNQLRSTLREFHAAALDAFDTLHHPAALAVLAIGQTPSLPAASRPGYQRR